MKTERLVQIFKALSSEQRLRLFLMIRDNCCGREEFFDKAFTNACECLDISRSTVSHHLKELQNAGLITCERTGQSFRCRVNHEALKAVKDLLKER